MSLLILSSTDVQKITDSFSTDDYIQLSVDVFSQNDAESPHRSSISNEKLTTLFMPARLPSLKTTSIKVVSVQKTVPGIPASTLVVDEDTGAVKAIINARALTALRTAAGSLLATRLLAPPPNPSKIIAFGAGNQIEAHLFLHLRAYSSLTHCTITTRALSPRADTLLATLSAQYPRVAFHGIKSLPPGENDSIDHPLYHPVHEADIIICATPSKKPLFQGSWPHPRAHIILVGSYTPSMHEVDTTLISRAFPTFGGTLAVDSREACMLEAGEIIDAGLKEEDMVELGELLARKSVDADDEKKNNDGVTLFKSVGIGAQDVAIAAAVLRRAEEMGLGTRIDGYDLP